MKFKLFFIFILLLSVSFVACNKNDDKDKPSEDKHMKLYDKWWYGTENQGRGDHYFGSDGTAIWTLVAGEGVWEWRSNDSLKIVFPSNPPLVFWFTKIEDNEIEYWPNTEPEGAFFQFSTTKP